MKRRLRLSFLASVPDASAQLKEPDTKEKSFEDLVKSAQAAALVWCFQV